MLSFFSSYYSATFNIVNQSIQKHNIVYEYDIKYTELYTMLPYEMRFFSYTFNKQQGAGQ